MWAMLLSSSSLATRLIPKLRHVYGVAGVAGAIVVIALGSGTRVRLLDFTLVSHQQLLILI